MAFFGLVILVLSLIGLLLVGWFHAVSWQVVFSTLTSVATLAPYGIIFGALARKYIGRNKGIRSWIVGIIAILLFAIPYSITLSWRYEHRPIPEDKLANLVWQILVWDGITGAGFIGASIMFQINQGRSN